MQLSVRFFKRLILIVLCLLILAPSILAILFYRVDHVLAGQVDTLSRQVVELEAAASLMEQEGTPQTYFAYQTDYPDLYYTLVNRDLWQADSGVAYLTFDGAATAETMALLDTLDDLGVKATFFVTGGSDTEEGRAALRAMVEREHTVGILSYSCDYEAIYASVDDYLADFSACYEMILSATGVAPSVFRFYGGSVNSYNYHISEPLIAEMLRRGFIHFDYTASAGDAVPGATGEGVAQVLLADLEGQKQSFIQFHATSGDVVLEAVPATVAGLFDRGFDIAALTSYVMPVVFGYLQYQSVPEGEIE